MDRVPDPAPQFEVDVDLGFALFFLGLLCLFLLATVVRCAQTVVDPYGSISISTYEEEQITWVRERYRRLWKNMKTFADHSCEECAVSKDKRIAVMWPS